MKNAFGEFNNAMKHWNIKDQSGIVVQVSTLANIMPRYKYIKVR